METLKLICLTIVLLVKQILFLPQTIAMALQKRRVKLVVNEIEAERLDRLRNPSKYQGK
jgi:hypothetical protein